MVFYVAESDSFAVDHGGRESRGVLGEHKGREKIYLHVLPLTAAEIEKLVPRVDDDGNAEHARLSLPNTPEWWIAVEGEVAFPKLYRPRITSRCEDIGSKPRPAPLSTEDLERLRKSGVAGI